MSRTSPTLCSQTIKTKTFPHQDNGKPKIKTHFYAGLPPPQEESGICPWELLDDHFPEFIISEDVNGREVLHTCDQERLENYFGKNADAPHYLTPVFFRPEVLKRYYDDPFNYSVSDGRLSRANLWSVQIDNGMTDVVVMFLGDLGRDLPANHRDHWRSYNIPPYRALSEPMFRRSFLAQSAESANPEHMFKNAYQVLQRTWFDMRGWNIYRKPVGTETQILERVRVPLNDSDTEFEAQILDMAKLLVDLLDEAAVAQDLEPVANERGISKLKRRLELLGYPHAERDAAFLRQLQALRSRVAAHTPGSNGQRWLAAELKGITRRDFVIGLMRRATQTLGDLAEFDPTM